MSTEAQFIWGFAKAAKYLGVSRMTLWRIIHSPERTEQERKLLTPRIVSGRVAFRKRDLDLFMSPALNAPGARPHNPFSNDNE